MTSDDRTTVIEGSIADEADWEDVKAIRDAIQRRGFDTAIDRDDGTITVHRDADTGQQRTMTKRERRIQRLQEGIEEGEAYTSDELCAIAYEKDVDDVTLSDQAYVSKLRGNGDIDLQTMPDPNRHGNAKLYYRGERPDVEVLDEPDDQEEQESDTAACRYCGKEYKKRGVRRHERACDENPDVETAWTVSRVETVMEGNGWMTVEEIALQVLDQAVASPDERNRFHNLVSRKPELKARLTSRPDPANRQRNQYRLITDEPADEDEDSEDSADATSGRDCDCPVNEAGEVQHEGDCPAGAAQEIEEMQDLYTDDEQALPDPEPEPEPAAAGTNEDDDEDDGDAFTCTACGQQFDTFHELRDHHCDTGDFPCPECDTAFDDDEALQNHLRDKHPGFYGDAPVTHDGTDEDADDGEDDEELLEEMGPCNIGKIAVKGTFRRYECQCGKTFEEEQSAMDHSDETGHTLGWTAYDQLPKDHEKSLAKVSGPSTMR